MIVHLVQHCSPGNWLNENSESIVELWTTSVSQKIMRIFWQDDFICHGKLNPSECMNNEQISFKTSISNCFEALIFSKSEKWWRFLWCNCCLINPTGFIQANTPQKTGHGARCHLMTSAPPFVSSSPAHIFAMRYSLTTWARPVHLSIGGVDFGRVVSERQYFRTSPNFIRSIVGTQHYMAWLNITNLFRYSKQKLKTETSQSQQLVSSSMYNSPLLHLNGKSYGVRR